MSNGDRTELQEILEEVLGSDQVYFQPPESLKMTYPAIVYKRSSGSTRFASDMPYVHQVQYEVTVIGKDPDSYVLGAVARLESCVFVRHFVSDNLNHDVFMLYY